MERIKFILYTAAILCQQLIAQNQFTNQGNIKIHGGGNITFFGNFINNGSYIDSGNVTTLSGTSAQKIGGTSNTIFKNLTLNNNAGTYLSSSQSILGELNIASGTFSTTGYGFTLISNANGTARIAPILGNISGNITMERYIGPGVNDWRFLASPVTGVTINDWKDNFITSGFPGSHYPTFPFVSIYTYDETVGGINDYGYNSATSANESIIPGKGYWCYIGPAPLTVDVTGPPVKFNQNFNVSYTPSGGAAQDGWVMIGNPYPCPINWDSPSWTKTKINNAIYIWNPAKQQYASYVSGIGINGGSAHIASSQSFWIQTNGTAPALSCTEDVKISNNAAFVRPENTHTFATIGLAFHGNGYSDESIVRFGNSATKVYDASLDARKMYSSNTQVPSLCTLDSAKKEMSVNSQPELNSMVHIPIRTTVPVSGIYTIAVNEAPEAYCIVLEDLLTHAKISLSSGASYSFHINDTTSAPRFLLHVNSNITTRVSNAKCFGDSNGKIVAAGKGNGPWNYTWYDASSTIVKQTFNSSAPDSLVGLRSGNYALQVSYIGGECPVSTSTLVVTQPDQLVAQFSIYGQYYVGNDLHLQNQSINAIAYEWSFGDGEVSTETFPKHRYSEKGIYSLQLISKHLGCSDTLAKQVQILDPMSVSESENKNIEFSIYPNPTTGSVKVKVDRKGLLQIFTSTGQLVMNTNIHPGTSELNLGTVAPGVYFYRLSTEDDSIQSGKLIKE